MSFDKETRNLLSRTVSACRRRLLEDVTDQLRGKFGMHGDGTIIPVDRLTHLSASESTDARALRDLAGHYATLIHGSPEKKAEGVFERLSLEISFTILNRLAALRLCEERGLVIECIRKGTASDGFRLFESLSGGALGPRYETYQVFLELMFDELAGDLGVLFDRTTPQSAIFPSERCFEDLIALLNDESLSPLWKEDETIGWIYQYFNPPEERKAMREASQAPRNSRELAVRNQFFTPRYVVEFLTDNTLGRIWYEMRKGLTALVDSCRYLVRRPNEIFLKPGEQAPAGKDPEDNDMSQEELLKLPVYIEHRAKKDPRDLKILDPACGSGHFLLYVFILLEIIYREAWEDADSPTFTGTGHTLRTDYPTIEALQLALPELILRHNLHGIDIDPRAVQIAALALWLRAQRYWQSLGLKAAERPRISKSNIVCAEPMPGEEDLLKEFTSTLRPRVLGQVVEIVFEKMKLAGEAGSLLKIEEEIKDALTAAKTQWLERPREEQLEMFPAMKKKPQAEQLGLFDVRGISDAEFWDKAEGLILDALRDYAEQAQNGEGVRRRLFAEDAAQGFAFVDVCRKRFDVVLMNPPFGLCPQHDNGWLKSAYSSGYTDIYAAFFLRALGLCEGAVGAITSRSWLVTKKLYHLRKEMLLDRMHSLLDLGWPVMDDATVQSCATVLDSDHCASRTIPVFDKRLMKNKEELLLESIRFGNMSNVYLADRSGFLTVPLAKFLYSLPSSFLSLFRTGARFAEDFAETRLGMRTFDDFRFIRMRVECVPEQIGQSKTWVPLTKGGPFATFYSDLPLVVWWDGDGKQVCEVNRIVNGQTAQSRQASSHYYRCGGTYSRRAKDFGVRVLPAGFIIGEKGPAVLPVQQSDALLSIGILNSRLYNLLVNIQANAKQYDSGIVDRLPSPELSQDDARRIMRSAQTAIDSLREVSGFEETTSIFRYVPCKESIAESFAGLAETWDTTTAQIEESLAEINQVIDLACDVDSLGLCSTLSTEIDAGEDGDVGDVGEDPSLHEDNCEQGPLVASDSMGTTASAILSHFVGAMFGRWDIRFATGQCTPPALPDPFAPLPICPPGMLQNSSGLPAAPSDVPADYPLRISWDGILVDDPGFDGAVAHKEDIVRRVREVFDVIWKGRAQSIEQEACQILGVSDLRDYFRKPSGFFQDHLKRYSKSRRKAPIYWPLSTPSGSYTVWVYYQRLTDQTIYTVVNRYLEPKISEVERSASRLESSLPDSSGASATHARDRLDAAKQFLIELREFREELLRIAALPFKPNLNDGVIINAAPFHRLFRLRSWAKDTEEIWKKLSKGDYDWAHLAYTIRPDRVREVCKRDRSIAIAHDLENLCEVNPPAAGSKKGRRKKQTEEELANEEDMNE
jgi:hypothetical protein